MWFQVSMSPLKSSDGTVNTLLLNAFDLTERNRGLHCMNERNIPFGRPMLDQVEIDLVTKVLQGTTLVHGPMTHEFEQRFANPYIAAEFGFVDEVILPRETRLKLVKALAFLETKRDATPPKKHGNIPL